MRIPDDIVSVGTQCEGHGVEQGCAPSRSPHFDAGRLLGDEGTLGKQRLGVPEDLGDVPAGRGRDVVGRLAGAYAGLDLAGAEGVQDVLRCPRVWDVPTGENLACGVPRGAERP